MRTRSLAASILAAALTTSSLTSPAHAAWGLLFEVSADGGATWTRDLTIDTSTGPKRVQFRIATYHDGTDLVFSNTPPLPPSLQTGFSIMMNRFTGSNRIENFPLASEDRVLSYGSGRPNPDPLAMTVRSELREFSYAVPARTILGRPDAPASFASHANFSNDLPFRPRVDLLAGELEVGGNTPAAREREILFTINTFGAGTQRGLTFYFSPQHRNSGQPITPPTHLPATIRVTAGGCPADLNHDGFVDDTDFVIFTKAYNTVTEGADFTGDGITNDNDFVVFARAYNDFLCP